ncbi:MAG: glycosyltransferase family 1 protein [Patescibacteria group bacterium]
MTIGIDASRAFLKRRTGIEEYAYQTIKNLRVVLVEPEEVILYVRKKWMRKDGKLVLAGPDIDFDLPENWKVRGLWAPRFWTQGRLSLEMLFGKRPDMLFVPAHTVPVIHPRKTIVVIHGLEYEVCPEGYSFWERLYMRFSIRYSCKAATSIVSVSENTKKDLMRLYSVAAEKISVIGEGFDPKIQSEKGSSVWPKPYLLFLGRLEERKNIVRIIEAFEILKEKKLFSEKLILAGKWGYGKEKIQAKIESSPWRREIVVPGYIDEAAKGSLLSGAQIFLFPTLYEGFGIPVLEAQSVGVPVITSTTSSLPEVAGLGALFVDPLQANQIAEGMEKILTERDFRDDIIQKGKENLSRYAWDRCARELAVLFRKS